MESIYLLLNFLEGHFAACDLKVSGNRLEMDTKLFSYFNSIEALQLLRSTTEDNIEKILVEFIGVKFIMPPVEVIPESITSNMIEFADGV